MLYLICGPSGSGKTKCLLESIRRDVESKTPCILLVPEQQVYTSEREFPKYLPKNAGRYFEILSFTGLSEKLFKRFGGLQFLSADQSVRSLMMWNVLRELKGTLLRYGSESNDGSLTKLMCSAVEDLRINGITPEELDAAAEALPEEDPLQKKLRDLSLVYASYHGKMDHLFEGKIPEERLSRLADLLAEKKVFADTHFYVDSFTSFTYDENRVLSALMEQAKEITIALCIDRLPSSQSHFKSISETGKHLKELAKKASIRVDELFLTRKDTGSDLSYLEQNLWRFGAPAYSGDVTHVKLLSARNVYEESEAAAESILTLVDQGIRFGEIAVVVRDFETYRGWLDAALEKRAIPYFLSERNEFSQKPLARLILSSLRAVLYGYRAQDILSILKTGLSGVSFRDASLFEEYVETWHITGKRFLDEEWKMNPDGLSERRPSSRGEEILDAANRVRKHLISNLQELSKSLPLKEKRAFSESCEALYDYLLKIDLPNTLLKLAKEELERDSVRDAEEGVRLFNFLTELLGKAIESLQDEKLSAEEFLSAMSLLFANSDLGSVPLVNDCVILGSASTLRVENVKATLVLGLCEGEFPGDIAAGGILTENEKKRLYEDYGVEFRSNAELKQSEELFYVYRTFTKPTEMLILSTPKSLGGTGTNEPSIAFERVKKLMRIEQEESYVLPSSSYVSVSYDREEKQVESTSAKCLELHATDLRQFALCPYSYHVTQTLKLRKEADSLQGSSESGNFLHHVFAEYLKKTLKDQASLQKAVAAAQVDRDFLHEIIRNYVKMVCKCEPEDLDPQLLHQFERLSEVAAAALYGLQNDGIMKELLNSGFLPTNFESKFEKEFSIGPNGKKVVLGGRIDRIDRKVDEAGQTHFRVIDYKSSEHEFKAADIKTGKEVQLVLYLMTMLETHPKWIPDGADYLYAIVENVKKPRKGEFYLHSSGFRVTGATDPTFVTYQKDLTSNIEKNANAILNGYAQKTPSSDACQYCPLKMNCAIADRSKKY